MTKTEKILVEYLNEDLRNEHTHMHFYLQSSSAIRGIHRMYLKEWLEEEAESEMGHVKEFSEMIVSLGGTPTHSHHDIPYHRDATDILEYAIVLEQDVVDRYEKRIEEIKGLSGADDVRPSKLYQLVLFYEKQIEHSHADLDELRQMVANRTDSN